MPDPVAAWLTVCNGVIAGPGGLYGWRADSDFLDFQGIFQIYPHWLQSEWIPIAGDGHGNHYAFDASRSHLPTGGVYLVDVHETDSELGYIVGSNVLEFLHFLLEDDIERSPWPFGRDYVLARDPTTAKVSPQRLLPWLRPLDG